MWAVKAFASWRRESLWIKAFFGGIWAVALFSIVPWHVA